MSQKKKLVSKIAIFLMAFAAVIPTHTSFWLIGEPELPQKIKKTTK